MTVEFRIRCTGVVYTKREELKGSRDIVLGLLGAGKMITLSVLDIPCEFVSLGDVVEIDSETIAVKIEVAAGQRANAILVLIPTDKTWKKKDGN